MLSFLYSVLLKLLYPTSVAILLLLASALLRRRARASLAPGPPPAEVSGFILRPSFDLWSCLCFWSALAVLLACGNGWVVGALTKHLERQYPPHDPERELSSQWSVLSGPRSADCILVLGGGNWPKLPPRTTVEVGEAGDRLLYAAHLYRRGHAPVILCTSGIATGGIALQPGADVMAEFLVDIGVPTNAILRETASRNTREHAVNLESLLKEQGFHRILLVTSAMHMPRSMGVFRKNCPAIEFVPAPTDFRATDPLPVPWYRHLAGLIPTPSNLAAFSEVQHEYLGMLWYRLRGWM
jgi:uncharacterized SAM-binding protein YcdF (DUF218 family)